MEVQLTATQGARSATIPLRLPTVIGRGGDAKIRVPQAWVSRRHCALYCEAGRLYVRDLGSANGTFLNEARIEEARQVAPGDSLRIGKVTFRIDVASPSGPHDPTAKHVPSASPSSGTEDPVIGSAGSLADCHYRELDEGSFIAIDTGQPCTAEANELPEIEVAGRTNPVDDDSALGRFLKGLPE